MPSAMPARTAVACAAASCSSSSHCSQRWKSTVVGVLGGEVGDRRAGRMLQLLGPLVPVVAVLLGERAPGGEVVEAAALALRGTPRTPARGPPTARRGSTLSSAARLASHAASRSIRSASSRAACTSARALPDAAALADVGELGDRLDPQVQRVDEPARRRQVRRRLHRRGRRRGVQRVDQDEAGAVPRGRPHREVGQVGQIADAPRSFASARCRAGWPAPMPGSAPSLAGSSSDAGVTITSVLMSDAPTCRCSR